MALSANSFIRQHQTMARGGSIEAQDGGFGVGKLGAGCKTCTDIGGSVLADTGRSAVGPIARGAGMMGATAHSDHGPHLS